MGFVKQAVILAIASLLVRFMGFLYRLPLTELIGDLGNGYYGAGYNLYTFFLILSSAGIPAAISKLVSERNAKGEYENSHRVFKAALIVSGTLGFIAMLALFFGASTLARLVKTPQSYHSILTLAPTVFTVAIMAVFRGYFQGMGTTVPTAASQVIEQLFNAVFSVLLAYILVKESVVLGAAGGTAGTGIGAFFGLATVFVIYLRNRSSIILKIKRSKTRVKQESYKSLAITIIKVAAPIIAGTAIFSITSLLDNFMVKDRLLASLAFSQNQSDELYGQLVGKYVLLTTLPVSIATALATAAVPNISASVLLDSKATVSRKINMILKLAMLVSIPAAVGLSVLAQPIISLLMAKNPGGAILVQIGGVSVVFLALAQISTGLLQGIGKVSVPAFAAFFGALIKMPINYFLIINPKINVIGAVISTTVCYVVASVIDVTVLAKATGTKIDFKGIFIKPTISSGVMGLACFSTYNLLRMLGAGNAVSTIASIFVGGGVYFVILFLLGGISAQDLKVIPGINSKGRKENEG